MEECPEELPSGDIGSSGGKRKGVCGNEARGQEHAKEYENKWVLLYLRASAL